MTDLLSYLVSPARQGSAVKAGIARDLVAARVLAKKADEGHPHARAFVENAQERIAKAAIRRRRADRLRAGAVRASRMGYHDMARMGCEAANEEEQEAAAIEANVIGSVRATHAFDRDEVGGVGGYSAFSPEEERLLKRKAYEDSLSTGQREAVMEKLLNQLYQSSSTGSKNTGADLDTDDDADESDEIEASSAPVDTGVGDLAAYLHAAAEAFGGDLDSVFGDDAAARLGAASRAADRHIRNEILRREKIHARMGADELLDGLDDASDEVGDELGSAEDREDRQERRERRKAIREQIRELRRQLKALRHASAASDEAGDDAVGVDLAEDQYLDRATDSENDVDGSGLDSAIFGDDLGLDDLGLDDLGDDLGSDDFGLDDFGLDDLGDDFGAEGMNAGRVALAIASGGASEAIRAGAHAAGGKDGGVKNTAMIEKLKSMSDKKLRAVMNDGLRKKSIRAAAKAELARRARSADGDDDDDAGSSTSASYDEDSYLASYRGVAPARKKFVRFFRDRAARVGADDAAVIQQSLQDDSSDAFGGFFSQVGEFFSNMFRVGKRDAGRIASAGKAGRGARRAENERLDIVNTRIALNAKRLEKLKLKKAEEPDLDAQQAIQAEIVQLRKKLREDRALVAKAGAAASDMDFASSRGGDAGSRFYADTGGYAWEMRGDGTLSTIAAPPGKSATFAPGHPRYAKVLANVKRGTPGTRSQVLRLAADVGGKPAATKTSAKAPGKSAGKPVDFKSQLVDDRDYGESDNSETFRMWT